MIEHRRWKGSKQPQADKKKKIGEREETLF